MDTSRFMIVLLMLFCLYVLVLLAILADLWSGIRKAKIRGEARTSYGFRMTIDKLARYYNLLVILTIIDAMQITGTWYLDTYYSYNLPMIPLITLIGALGMGMIELKSIYEKAEDKELKRMMKLVTNIINDKEDVRKVSESIIDYLNEKNNNETRRTTKKN